MSLCVWYTIAAHYAVATATVCRHPYAGVSSKQQVTMLMKRHTNTCRLLPKINTARAVLECHTIAVRH